MRHLTSSQIAQYLSRALPPAEVVALHVHLESCAGCRTALERSVSAGMQDYAVPLLIDDDGEPHLSEDEMVAYVAGSMPEGRRADAVRHIAACESCRESVEVMESVRDRAFQSPARRPASRWFPVVAALAAALLIAAAIRFWPVQTAAPPGPPLVASLHDAGQSIELDAGGNLRGLAIASPEERSLVRDAMQQRSLPAGPKIAAEAPGVLLTPGAVKALFAPASPVNTRVLSDHPVFSWSAYSGATGYQVIVTNEALDPLARSGRIQATEWQSDGALPRGVALLWQVRAWLDAGHGGEMISAPAPPAPPARFEIVDTAVASRLDRLRTMPNPPHLLIAVVAARAGLREEAAKELQLLAQENPGSPLVQSLLGNSSVH